MVLPMADFWAYDRCVSLKITLSYTLYLFNLVFIKVNKFTFTENLLVLVNMNL